MILYSVIMFLAAVPFWGVSIAIYRGKTDLIHSYHQTKVQDSAAYGRAFGKAMLILPIAMILSGLGALVSDSPAPALAVLFLGLTVGICCILAVQKKYNRGLF